MKIEISERCVSLTGSLGSSFGYHIQRRKNGFYAKRESKGFVPPDGHWRFILACAELAQNGLYVSNIQISWTELYDALYEAGKYQASEKVKANAVDKCKTTYNATDIINLKTTFGL